MCVRGVAGWGVLRWLHGRRCRCSLLQPDALCCWVRAHACQSAQQVMCVDRFYWCIKLVHAASLLLVPAVLTCLAVSHHKSLKLRTLAGMLGLSRGAVRGPCC